MESSQGVNERRPSPWLLVAAVALGIAGESLFYRAGWGVNVSIWLAAIIGAVVLLRRSDGTPPLSPYLVVAFALALTATIRDAVTLRVITVIALIAAVSFATFTADRTERLRRTVFTYLGRIGDAVAVWIWMLGELAPSFYPAIARAQDMSGDKLFRVIRGLAFALLALAIFGPLLVSADAMFENLVINVFDFDAATLIQRSTFAAGWAWLACGVLFVLTVGPATYLSRTNAEDRTESYAIEVNIVLTTINALFLTFVAVQANYFFGGHERVLEVTGLTYAENARRGFFEISAVTLLAFAVVLSCDALIPRAKSAGRTLFHALVSLHILLMGVLIASAFDRLRLYVEAYGLTELRFYVAVAIAWIALAFLMLGYAIVAGKRWQLPRMIAATLFAAVFLLHAVNPAALVMRTNLARADAGQEFDAAYALSLSADAVPALIGRLDALTSSDRVTVTKQLRARWDTNWERELRDWNFSRWQAARRVQAVLETDQERSEP